METKRLEEIERAHELGEPWAPTHDLCLSEDEDMRELVAEVRALTALLEATYLPLSIRELRRTEGTAAAAKEWRAKSDAFLEGLQKERDEALAEVKRLRAEVNAAELRGQDTGHALGARGMRERCAKAICSRCADGMPFVVIRGDRPWRTYAEHTDADGCVISPCDASAIHALPDEPREAGAAHARAAAAGPGRAWETARRGSSNWRAGLRCSCWRC